MILNSESVQIVRANAQRLAQAIQTKDELLDLATAESYEEVFLALEAILTSTDMHFDDEFLALLDANNWKTFKAILMVYTLNLVNRNKFAQQSSYNTNPREVWGATPA